MEKRRVGRSDGLRARLQAPLNPSAPGKITALGDWYANIVHVDRFQLVLAISERISTDAR